MSPRITNPHERLDAFVEHLRDEHRLKLNCDYTYIFKYAGLTIICPHVWLAVIKEHTSEYMLPARYINCPENWTSTPTITLMEGHIQHASL